MPEFVSNNQRRVQVVLARAFINKNNVRIAKSDVSTAALWVRYKLLCDFLNVCSSPRVAECVFKVVHTKQLAD